MNSNTNDRHIEELVSELLDGELSQEQRLELLAALRADEQMAQKVINLFIDGCVLDALCATGEPESFVKRVLLNARYLETGESFADRVATAAFQQDMIDSLAPEDKQRIEEVRRLAERQLKDFLDKQEQEKRQQQPSPRYQFDLERMAGKARAFIRYTKKAVVATTVSVSIILLVLVGFQQILAYRVVATLSQTIHAQWDQAPEQNDLHPGWMRLEQGYAGIRFKDGAEVIIQAPSIFKLNTSNRMFLESGWITAKVPKEATGFTVNTPASSVIDYGTEFGLMVGTESSAEVHVFEGNIGLKSDNNSTGSTQRQKLEKGETATIDITGHIDRSTLEDRANLFVRTMPTGDGFGIPGKRLNLADMIGGGNGLDTGVLGQGLDPTTGEITPTRKLIKANSNGFIEVPYLLFVDGVFVPDANDEPVVITSTGIMFEECPKTLGKCYESINNSARFQARSLDLHLGCLTGQTYGTKEHPSIGMHPNMGITFDLAKIRSFMPKVEITRFQALCGVSETVSQYCEEDADPTGFKVDFWVLVDGRIRFSKTLAAAPSSSAQIDMTLGSSDRFLTLATTNPGEYLYCWGMFAEPMLELTTESYTMEKGK